MKKISIFLFLISLLFIPNLVSAKTFEVNGEQIEVTKDNYIYYFYNKYSDIFDKYQYFVGFTQSDTGFSVVLTNSTNLTYNGGFYGPTYSSVGTYHYFYLNLLNNYEQNQEKTSGNSLAELNALKFSNFDISASNYNFSANISSESSSNKWALI